MIDKHTCKQCGTIIRLTSQWQIDNNYSPKICGPCIRENELVQDEIDLEFEQEYYVIE